MEETGGFEPPALRFCKPFHWTALARLLNGVLVRENETLLCSPKTQSQ
jgi:hypothetical protein